MKLYKNFFLLFTLFFCAINFAQTKVSGMVFDNTNNPVPYANVVFKGSKIGVNTDETGKFYMQSDLNYKAIEISFVGFTTKEVLLTKPVTYDLKVILSDGEVLNEVVIYSGKTSKKDNPALDILRKIWERKRKNGLQQFNQYQYQKYEKVEFDLNTIDSAFANRKIFKGLEFVFQNLDTSKVTGKTYLPIFINESLYDVYGDNKLGKKKEVVKANKNSGLSNGDGVNAFIKDLYNDYNIYNNYLNFFDKSFTSPLSTTGIDVYNYVLRDSTFIKDKCLNFSYSYIVFFLLSSTFWKSFF